jgi:membrane associated rhomboid family serine protease
MSNFKFTRPDRFPPIVKNLIIINVLVYLAQVTLDKQFQLTEKISLYPIMPEQLRDILVQNRIYESFEKFYPYQIATHLFAHSPQMLFHILFNMFALWMFGRILENVWGSQRFLLFYLICGVGAAACHLAIQYFRCEELLRVILENPNDPRIATLIGAAAPALGASGAIMGVLAAFAVLFPNTELYIMFIPVPVKAKWAVLGMAAIDLFGGVASFSGDNVAHFAHLGGAITGFILVMIWNKTNRRTFY